MILIFFVVVVVIFEDSNGNFQLSFGSEGSHPGQFKHPRGISQGKYH